MAIPHEAKSTTRGFKEFAVFCTEVCVGLNTDNQPKTKYENRRLDGSNIRLHCVKPWLFRSQTA